MLLGHQQQQPQPQPRAPRWLLDAASLPPQEPHVRARSAARPTLQPPSSAAVASWGCASPSLLYDRLQCPVTTRFHTFVVNRSQSKSIFKSYDMANRMTEDFIDAL
jgi:hypothetical protein